MNFKLNAKAIFIILIFSIVVVLVLNYVNRNKQINSEKIEPIDPSKEGKTVGVNIEQNQLNGDKIKIIADLMEENKEKQLIKLFNPVTNIIKKNNITKITSNYAYIIDNYKKFKLNKDVKIYNSEKQFTLKTETLTGTFDSGNMNTNLPVDIQIKNSKIHGSSLILKNYGEYIKVLGKARLTID